ncbi:flagellar type III secretion system pore protein FliP [Pusillimonas sp. TS35]|uniref:flagellar type III secretion system pore protein FliP n=1 Tax=Paracandidimonas lactea TaxID=2895524 RepID=UPI001371F69A|nr:flagellar type III secretion system pore protein FliP [Paracandidimonas lactea]MYN11649.1 flagellar type III secretion system pore protein FliP [Pusillimonas sp. TS35]
MPAAATCRSYAFKPSRTARAGRSLACAIAIILFAAAFWPLQSAAQLALPSITSTPNAGGGATWSLSIQTLVMLTMMSFLPAMLMMMTGFTRIIIVLGLLRNAMGTGTAPPNSVLIGIALFLTFFAMSPVFDRIYADAYQPLAANSISFQEALDRGAKPLHAFMLRQTREADLSLFANMAGITELRAPEDTPLRVLVPAFVTSELKTAFQIGFTIFIPFLIIDLVVASVLMALGMMMVPPVTISLPFKLMLFVLADGWHLLLGSLARSFYQ